MLNKKAALAAGAGVLCVSLIAAGVLTHRGAKPESAVFNTLGAQSGELIDVISAPVDISGSLKQTEAYTPLTVKKAFLDGGGCARVIVYNDTDTTITAYDLEIMYFDKNGMPTGETGAYTVSGIKLQGRHEFGIDRYVGGSNGGKYIKAVIKRVLYNDGTAWENTNAELELKLGGTSFDIDEYKKSILKNEENVKKAAQNPYIFINNMTMANADTISGRRDLKLVLTNTSQKTVTAIKTAVAEFDRDNKPVDVSPQIYIGKNIRLASCGGMELTKGESRSFSSSGFLESECYRINVIVTEITFSDGTVWENPYALDWLLWFM